MKTRDLTLSAIFLGIGTALHFVAPGIFLGVTPDFILAFMFLAICIDPSFKKTIVIGLSAGILSALATKFPGGQIPNIIDKIVTSVLIYGIINAFTTKEINSLTVGIIQFIGTFLSGIIFLTSATLVVGFDPESILPALGTVVAAAALGNVIIGIIVFKAFAVARKSVQYN